MATITADLSVSQLNDMMKKLKSAERQRIIRELYEMEEGHIVDQELKKSIGEADAENVHSHESVMAEVRAKLTD